MLIFLVRGSHSIQEVGVLHFGGLQRFIYYLSIRQVNSEVSITCCFQCPQSYNSPFQLTDSLPQNAKLKAFFMSLRSLFLIIAAKNKNIRTRVH